LGCVSFTRWFSASGNSRETGACNEYQAVTVTLFDFSKKKIGEKLLEIPGSKIVMVEWAMGSYVQTRSETLTLLQSRGLPSPIQKVQQAPK
jgi:hypothetical protein